VQRLLTFKNVIPLCHWKYSCLLFLLVQRLAQLVIEFSVDEPFFSHFSLFSSKNYSSTFLFVDISTSVFIFFIFNFQSWPFYWSFICFQFYPSILIYQISYSSMWSSFFIFLNFIVCSFIRVLVVFNLIIQFKLMILFFKFGLCFFYS
jgi:hypothetical protein